MATAAADNSAPSAIRPDSTYKLEKVVQTSGATSAARIKMATIFEYSSTEPNQQ